MEMSVHPKFIQELRAPVKKHNKMLQERLKTDPSAAEEQQKLMDELEARFNALFGPQNDDD